MKTENEPNSFLASIMNDLSINKDIIENNELDKKHLAQYIDFQKFQVEAEKEAEKYVESVKNFYLHENMLENPFILNKINNDRFVLSKIIFQMRTSEMSIIKLLEEIDHGNFHARNFEVLAGLQKSNMEIAKHLVQVKTIIEQKYKDLAEDDLVKKQVSGVDNSESQKLQTGVYHKSLLQSINLVQEETNVFDR